MLGLSTHNHLAFTFGLLGNLISFMVYLAPLPTFQRIYRKKSTEGFQSVPYIVALFSAMLWIYYALLKSVDAGLLITINSVGCFIETTYIILYLVYASKDARIYTAKLLLLLNIGLFGLIVLLSLLVMKGSDRVVALGWVCVGFSVCVFVAPLSIIRLVIQTKSVEFMPFYLSFFLTISAVVWFFYGLLSHDIYVAIPNVLGFLFGLIQMLLYAVYMNRSNTPPPTTTKNVELQEEGNLPEHIITISKSEVYPIDSKEATSCDNSEGEDKECELTDHADKKESMGGEEEEEVEMKKNLCLEA